MTLWEWRAISAGVARFHGGDDQPTAPAPEEFDAQVLDFHRHSPWQH